MLRLRILVGFLAVGFFTGAYTQVAVVEEKRIVIVVASYNNAAWYTWNLDSLLCQEYKNYHIIYIDDCSADGTYELVKKYLQEKEQEQRVTLIKNEKRLGALANQYRAIHGCNNSDIIMICDGDDALNGPHVLAYINQVYQNPQIWLTFGQFMEIPSGIRGFCHAYPAQVIKHNTFRNYQDTPSHLRTFYAGLFKHIHKKDLMYAGDFFEMTGDMATMIPMIEMAADHHAFIPQILYLYNANNPISDHHKNKTLQVKIDKEIRNRSRYKKLQNPFGNEPAQYRK